jgi:hypothetical protein
LSQQVFKGHSCNMSSTSSTHQAAMLEAVDGRRTEPLGTAYWGARLQRGVRNKQGTWDRNGENSNCDCESLAFSIMLRIEEQPSLPTSARHSRSFVIPCCPSVKAYDVRRTLQLDIRYRRETSVPAGDRESRRASCLDHIAAMPGFAHIDLSIH